MNDDPSQHKKLTVLLIVLLAIVLLSSSVIFASENGKQTNNNKIVKQPEPLKEIKFKKTKYSPYSVKINKTHIVVKGAYPRKKGYKYKRYTRVWKNYFNGKWGYIKYEQASLNGYKKGFSPIEGMLYYTGRDRLYDVDFDMVSGHSGDYGGKYHLKSW